MSILRQAVLVAVAAIIVAFVLPSYFKPSYPVPEIFGTVAPGFEEVREVFRQNYKDNWDNRTAGSAFSVYHEGETVVDLWAGYADVEATRIWKEDTLTIMYSCTTRDLFSLTCLYYQKTVLASWRFSKEDGSTSVAMLFGLAALCIGMLADRGLLDFNTPVAHYWPEFGQKGKDKITVGQLLAHQAGLHITDEPFTFDLLRDHNALDKVLAESSLKWEPGTNCGYHGVTIGVYMDALVRRVDPKKRTVGRFFEEEVGKPFGIDAYIGLPLELFHRAARNIIVDSTLTDLAFGLWTSPFFRKTAIGVMLGSDIFDKYIQNMGEILESGNLFGASGGQVMYADPNYKIGYGFLSRYNSPMGFQMLDPRFKRLQERVLKAVNRKKDIKRN